MLQILVDEDKCIGCGKCYEICPKAAKIWKINSVAHILDLRYCHVCTICAMACPTDCIKIIRPGQSAWILEARINYFDGYSMARIADISRKTSETDISIKLNLDGEGIYNISTGVNFFNHMLESFSKHSMIDLDVKATGDIEIDDHHTIEDVGILLGEAFNQAIGDKKGIKRMAHAIVPMDEAVSTVAIDISGRSYCNMNLNFKNEKIGDMTSDIVIHFFESFASSAKLNIYATLDGVNDHHKAEALFKAFAKAIKEAVVVEHNQIPSTKGVL